MEYKSFECLGEFYFTDNLQQVKNKLGDLPYAEDDSLFMGRENRRLYVPKYKLHILFGKKEKSIDCFEIEKGDFIFNGIHIFESDFSELFHKIKSLDETLELNEEEGFESKN